MEVDVMESDEARGSYEKFVLIFYWLETIPSGWEIGIF